MIRHDIVKETAKQPLRPRHVPQRTCIACGEKGAKRELIRIVRTADGTVEIDPTGKEAGRGAYLCKARRCWEIGLKKNRLERALKTRIVAEKREELSEYSKMLS